MRIALSLLAGVGAIALGAAALAAAPGEEEAPANAAAR